MYPAPGPGLEGLLLDHGELPRVAPVALGDGALPDPDHRLDPLPGEEVEVGLRVVRPVREDPPHPHVLLGPLHEPLQPLPVSHLLRRHVHRHDLPSLRVHREVYLQVPLLHLPDAPNPVPSIVDLHPEESTAMLTGLFDLRRDSSRSTWSLFTLLSMVE